MDGIYKNDIDYTNDQQNNILQTNEESQKDFFSPLYTFEDKYLLKGIEVLDLPSDSDDSDFDEYDSIYDDDFSDEYEYFYDEEEENEDPETQNQTELNSSSTEAAVLGSSENDRQISICDDQIENSKNCEKTLNQVEINQINKEIPLKKSYKNELKEIFQNDYRKFFTANFLTSKAKEKIKEFVSRKKYSKLSLEEKCDIIYISRRTFTNYKKKDMSQKCQSNRNLKKGRTPKLTKEQTTLFLQKCREMRDSKLAVTSKWARKIIKQITSESGIEWCPCRSTISNIFLKNGWHRRKSQSRNPQSDPDDKDAKIQKFKDDVKKVIVDNNLRRKNVHIMDETGLYSDSIPPYTWTFQEDKQAYVCSSGTKRRDTLVATLTANGDGFATFIRHRNQKTKTVKGRKEIIDPGVKGMNIIEMKKWVNGFKAAVE